MSSLPIVNIAAIARCAFSGSGSLNSGRVRPVASRPAQQLREPLEAARPALLVAVTGLHRCEQRLVERHLGATIARGERDGHYGLRSRPTLLIDPAMREHQPLG